MDGYDAMDDQRSAQLATIYSYPTTLSVKTYIYLLNFV